MSIISKIMELSEEIVKKTDSNTTQKTVKNVIGFYGIKAGLGTSTIVANTAIVLASNGYKVCVIDMDVHFPVQIRLLGGKSNKKIHSFIDAFLNTSINLAEVFNDSILPNLKLLSTSPTNTPTKFFDMPEIQVRKMIEESSLLFDLVLIDFGGADVGYETTTRGLPCCNQVYTVITPNADILEGTFKMFSFFREFKYTNADILVIQNMVIEDPIKGAKLKEFDMTHLMDLPYYSDIARLRYNDKLIIKSNIEGKSADVWRAGVLTLASLIADSSSADSYTTAATKAKSAKKKGAGECDANEQIKLNEDQLNKLVGEPEDEDDEIEFSVDRRNGPSPLEMAVQTSNQRTAEATAAKEKAALEARQRARAEAEEAEQAEAARTMHEAEAKAQAAKDALAAAKARGAMLMAEKVKLDAEAKTLRERAKREKAEREKAELESRVRREARARTEAITRAKADLEAQKRKAEEDILADDEYEEDTGPTAEEEIESQEEQEDNEAKQAHNIEHAAESAAEEEKSHVVKQSAEQALAQEKLQQAIAKQRAEEIEAKKVAAELAAKRIAEQEAKEKEAQVTAKAEAEQAAKVEAERKARIEADQRAAEEEAKAEAERVARAAEAEEARIIAELERQAAALEREAEAVRQQEALRLTKLKQQQAEEDARHEQQRRDAELLAQHEAAQRAETTKSISAISLNELTAHRTPSGGAQATGAQAQQRYTPHAEPVVERANVARPAARPINYKTPVSVKQEVEPQRTVLLQKPLHAQGNRQMQLPETEALRKPNSTQDSIIPGVARAARPVAVSMLDNSMQVLKRFNLSGSKLDESPNPGEEPKEPMSAEPPKAEDLFSRYLGGGTTESKSPPPEISEYTPIATGAQSKQNDVVSAEKLAGIARMFDGVGDSDEETQQDTAGDAGDSEDAAARFAKMMHSMRDPEIIGAEELGGND